MPHRTVPNILSGEVFRQIVCVLIPGMLVVYPIMIILCNRYEDFRELAANNHTSAAALLLFAVLFIGMLMEELGANFESTVCDKGCEDVDKDNEKRHDHEDEFKKYLLFAFAVEPMGHRYLRRLVVAIKFETSCVPALAISTIGAGIAFWPYGCCLTMSICVAKLLIAAWMWYSSCQTAKVLCELRRHFNSNGFKIFPQPQSKGE